MSGEHDLVNDQGAPVTIERLDNPTADDPNDPFLPQVGLRFYLNKRGAKVEVEMPEGVEMDERNPLHVLAWYVTNGISQLLPVAIQSWHTQRLAMLEDAQKATPAGGELVKAHAPRILGADAKPLG